MCIRDSDNLAIGYDALGGSIAGGEKNVAIGNYSLDANTSGDNNVAIGYGSLSNNTTGSSNFASGYNSLQSNTTGYNNIASGSQSLMSNTTGTDNTGLGANVLRSNTTGEDNTAVGAFALLSNTTGDNNVALGYNAGQTGTNNLSTGNNNVLLGASTATSKVDAVNQIVIGKGATGAGDNTVQLGNTSITNVKTSGTITAGAVTYPKTDGNANQVLKTDGSGNLGWTTVSTTPSGAIMMFAASSAPSGWLICDGSAVSRSTYSDLFSVIGTTYGSGDGSSTFNLPDFGGKGPMGYKSSNSKFDALNETGGAETHTLTVDEIPAHTHTYDKLDGGQHSDAGSGSYNDYSSTNSRTSGSTGGGQAHNILDPYLTVNFIIKQ